MMPWTAKQHPSGNLKQKKVISWAAVDQATDKKNDIKIASLAALVHVQLTLR